MKRLIKLVSTKARRRIDYECYISFLEPDELCMTSRFIELKAFGLFWVKIDRYVIYF